MMYRKKPEVIFICRQLFEKDYDCRVIKNAKEMCCIYPEEVIIPSKEKIQVQNLNDREKYFDFDDYMDKIKKSKSIRKYKGFVVPTILFKEVFICRATVRYESFVETCETVIRNVFLEEDFDYELNIETAVFLYLGAVFSQGISNDIRLLKTIQVMAIADLRLKKQYKSRCPPIIQNAMKFYQILYKEVTTFQFPYPDYDFSITRSPLIPFRKNRMVRGGLEFSYPYRDHVISFDLKEKNIKLLDITKEYLLLLLRCICSGNGILLHSELSQDRVPVFLTFLRMSLWADRVIHQSLKAEEIVYLSIAYDWFLFNHDLKNWRRREFQLLYFTFENLTEIADMKFSVKKFCENKESNLGVSNGFTAEEELRRKESLEAASKLFLDCYNIVF